MADRWISSPHVFPHCCHRCLKSGEENGPYWHEEWEYCQPDRWPGATPDAPRRARMFTCRSCYLHAANQDGAPLTDDSAKQLKSAKERVEELESQVASLEADSKRPVQVVDIESVLKLVEQPKPKRTPTTKKAAS